MARHLPWLRTPQPFPDSPSPEYASAEQYTYMCLSVKYIPPARNAGATVSGTSIAVRLRANISACAYLYGNNGLTKFDSTDSYEARCARHVLANVNTAAYRFKETQHIPAASANVPIPKAITNVHDLVLIPWKRCARKDSVNKITNIILIGLFGRYPYTDVDTGQVSSVQEAYFPARGSKNAESASILLALFGGLGNCAIDQQMATNNTSQKVV